MTQIPPLPEKATHSNTESWYFPNLKSPHSLKIIYFQLSLTALSLAATYVFLCLKLFLTGLEITADLKLISEFVDHQMLFDLQLFLYLICIGCALHAAWAIGKKQRRSAVFSLIIWIALELIVAIFSGQWLYSIIFLGLNIMAFNGYRYLVTKKK